jgi:hypothetical protein
MLMPRPDADSSSLPGRRCKASLKGSLPLKYSGPLSIARQLIAWQSMRRDTNGACSATPFDEQGMAADGARGRQREIHFEAQPLAVEVPLGVCCAQACRQRCRTLSSRKARPSAARQAHGFMRRERPRRSAMKSRLGDALHRLPATIDRTRFGASGTASASGLARFNLLQGLTLKFSSSSRVIRQTLLWFQRRP